VTPFFEMLQQAISSLAADFLFGAVVLLTFGLLILAILFLGLAVRGWWRWLIGHAWSDVVTSVETKAFRGRVAK
jgi:hypothetical protein